MTKNKVLAYQEFLACWELYKISKKSGTKNAALLADLMESDAPFFMTKDVKAELVSILRDFDKFQRNEDKQKALQTEREWISWFHYKNLRDNFGITASKQSIADHFGLSFDKVHKDIQRHYRSALEEKEPLFRKLYDDLRSKTGEHNHG